MNAATEKYIETYSIDESYNICENNIVDEKSHFVVSKEYIKQMQSEALYAKMNNESPEFPECPYYMEAYHACNI